VWRCYALSQDLVEELLQLLANLICGEQKTYI